MMDYVRMGFGDLSKMNPKLGDAVQQLLRTIIAEEPTWEGVQLTFDHIRTENLFITIDLKVKTA